MGLEIPEERLQRMNISADEYRNLFCAYDDDDDDGMKIMTRMMIRMVIIRNMRKMVMVFEVWKTT